MKILIPIAKEVTPDKIKIPTAFVLELNFLYSFQQMFVRSRNSDKIFIIEIKITTHF